MSLTIDCYVDDDLRAFYFNRFPDEGGKFTFDNEDGHFRAEEMAGAADEDERFRHFAWIDLVDEAHDYLTDAVEGEPDAVRTYLPRIWAKTGGGSR